MYIDAVGIWGKYPDLHSFPFVAKNEVKII